MQFAFAKSQIIERIRFDNPWWKTGQVEEYYQRMQRRSYFPLFQRLVESSSPKRAVVLMGPRRVGKTVMIYHSIHQLIERGVPPNHIYYLSIETPIYTGTPLEYLLQLANDAAGLKNGEQKDTLYFFFDEIQYLKDWEVHLKSLVDSYRAIKFVVSGSAAAALKLQSQESGAGRFTDFMLPPLTFMEFIKLKGNSPLIREAPIEWGGKSILFYSSSFIKELNEQFINYINFGGYPEVIFSEEMQSNPGRYIRNDIIDKVLLRDLPSLYGIQDVQELNRLFTMLAYNTGNEFSYEKISQASGGVPKATIKKYMEYLEAAFLLKIVRRVDQSAKRFKRDNFFKVFLTNPSLRSALFSPLAGTDDKVGSLVETAILAQWLHRDWHTPYYARWRGGEVDMVGLRERDQKPTWAVEVKWSNRYIKKPRELKNLLSFCLENQLKRALVTTIDKSGEIKLEGVDIQFLPAAAYAYTVGRRTFEQKNQ
ncbi:MAG TPA: ATP-binding protein [Phaeodactylibacter sp.]|nr:ATP-binding protein [Phaeodactylibacter sp.]